MACGPCAGSQRALTRSWPTSSLSSSGIYLYPSPITCAAGATTSAHEQHPERGSP